jgi:hypothetical protein
VADTIYAAQTPASTNFDADTHHWGMRFTVSADSNCVGARGWVHSSGRPTTFFWQLWNDDTNTLIAEVDLNTLPPATEPGWLSFTSADFSTPGDVALSNADTYIVNLFFQDGDGVFTDPGSFPVGVGIVSSDTGIFNNGAAQATIPATTSATYFFADVQVEQDGEVVTGTLNLTIPAPEMDSSGELTSSGILTLGVPALEMDAAGEGTVSGVLDLNIPAIEADEVGLVTVAGVLDLNIPALEMQADGQLPVTGVLNITIPAPEIDLDGASAAGGATVGPCGWTIPDPLCCPEWGDLDPTIQSSARDYAALILWAATARQFGLCTVTVRPCGMKRCNDGMAEFIGYDWSGGTWVPYIFNGTWFNCSCAGMCCCDPRCQVRLMGPVDSITEVLIGGIAVDPDTYRVDDNHWLVRTAGECWPTCADMDTDDGENTFEVTYVRGTTPPPALLRAASTLACEWGKACIGGDCRLSNRVTSIARQGINIEMASPEAFLDDGMTGLWEVDSVIAALNPFKRKSRARIWAPDMNVPRMVTSP